MDVRKGWKAYRARRPSSDIARCEASPHRQEGQDLASGVDVPFGAQGYQHGAERIEKGEGNGHDDTVHKKSVDRALRRRSAVCVPRPDGTVIPCATVVSAIRVSPNEGVGVLRDGRPREVEAELVPPFVLGDPLVCALRVKRIPIFPRSDPGRRAPAEVHVAALPALAVETRHIGGHDAVLNPRASEELEARVGLGCRGGVARSPAGADGDVAIAVGVEDEDVGVGHDGAGPDGNPGVAVGEGLYLEINSPLAGLGG